MARQENLTVIKAGLNRQRTKGAALKDTLYELLNGYVTTEKTVKVRPGTLLTDTLPAGTIGLVSHDGLFQVFASSDVTGIPAGYNLNIVRAPDGEALSKIHFAEPFLGALYVAAEFADGDIYHYWLQPATTWEADKMYTVNAAVQPVTTNSFVYRASRLGAPYTEWAADVPRTVGDKVEPSTYNGFYFEVTAVYGANPRSGETEPDFDVEEGQIVVENVDGTPPAPLPTPPKPPLFYDRDLWYDRYGGGRTVSVK